MSREENVPPQIIVKSELQHKDERGKYCMYVLKATLLEVSFSLKVS